MHFPGGRLTEYDQFFIKWLFLPFLSINILFFLLFTVSLFRYRKAKRINNLLIYYIVVLIILFVINKVFYVNLEHGQGG